MNITVERIFELMNEHGLKMSDLTKQVPLTNGLLTQWKKGSQKPSPENIAKLAKFFGVTTDYLLGNTNSRTLDEAADAFSITADKAVEELVEWLEDHGYEVYSNSSDTGSGVTWYISKNGETMSFEENLFQAECVKLAELINAPEDVIYKEWLNGKFKKPVPDEDDQKLIKIFNSLDFAGRGIVVAAAVAEQRRLEKTGENTGFQEAAEETPTGTDY